MPALEEARSLVDRIFSGDNRRLKLLAAQGTLPLPHEELIPLQIRLTGEAEPEIAGRAKATLKATEPRILIDYLNTAAQERELVFIAREIRHPEVLEALLRRRDIPRSLLVEIAPDLEPSLQEVLILRQDAIVEEPEILVALEGNPDLDRSVRRRILEYREHLLPKERPDEPVEQVEAREDKLEPSEEDVEAAISEAALEPAKGEKDDEVTGLTEGQIRLLPVPVRLKLSRGAPRTLRGILVKDTNSQVAISVLRNNLLSDEEVEMIARSRVVTDDVLEEVGRRREWMRKYSIICALVGNPRAPLATTVKLVPRLSLRDLRNLASNRNVPDAIRSTARRIHKQKMR